MSLRVLIGFADALAAIESAWCLDDEGFEVIAFAREGTRPALTRSRAVRVVTVTPPEQDAFACTEDLTALILELGPVAVLPLDDHAVWLCDRAAEQFSASDRPVIAGPIGRLAAIALDKRQQLREAEAAGLAVPPTVDAGEARLPSDGPWMVKPAMAVELAEGRLRRPTGRPVDTVGQVRKVAAAIGGPALAQPLIGGTGEGIFGLAASEGIVAWSAHRRIRMMNPRGSGSSACRSIPVDPELEAPVSNFIKGVGWHGLFMIEFLRDVTGRPWFMELNGRAWGSMALACRRGYTYPSWAVHQAMRPDFVPVEPEAAPHLTARHLGREVVHLGAVLTRGGAPRLKTLRDVVTLRRSDRWYNWRRGEAGVFTADSVATIRGQLVGRRRSS